MAECEEECSICYNELSQQDTYELTCNHKFHKDCITRWIRTNPTCPLCRCNVEASPSYVQDGIMTEETRLQLENSRTVFRWGGLLAEYLAPELLNNYSDQIDTFLDSETGQELLQQTARTRNPLKLMLHLVGLGIDVAYDNLRR